jgi:hypothetical protein
VFAERDIGLAANSSTKHPVHAGLLYGAAKPNLQETGQAVLCEHRQLFHHG